MVTRLRAWITRESGFGTWLGQSFLYSPNIHTGSDHSPPFSVRG